MTEEDIIAGIVTLEQAAVQFRIVGYQIWLAQWRMALSFAPIFA